MESQIIWNKDGLKRRVRLKEGIKNGPVREE